ncbi:MAG: aspartate carbamoyltransferase catalytic subunit [Chlorobia bacterium]|nr:aspartate carbamoyltransferase catalytic subunit [Fimbriimonadaceae bacterium]
MARNLLGIRHLTQDDIQELLSLSADFKLRILEKREVPNMSDQVVGMLFFENSTRTRVSFEQAAHYLKMKSANFSSGGSSMAKGETFSDTITTLRYERLNGLVIRHRASGSAALAARYFGGPVLNAGDGQHEHPTQALGDALTIIERKGELKGLQVSIVGDVEHSRVARSNAWLLSKMGAEVRFVGPRTLMPAHMQMLPGEVHYDLRSGIDGADVIICLRLQKERMADGMLSSITEYASMYQVNRESLRWANRDCIVMHPGPINRGVEVDDVAADGERSVINSQIENGIFVRMASLYWVFTSKAKSPDSPPPKLRVAKTVPAQPKTVARTAAKAKKAVAGSKKK